MSFTESQNGGKSPLEIVTPDQSRVNHSRLLGTMFRQVLSFSKVGNATTSLGNLHLCLTAS